MANPMFGWSVQDVVKLVQTCERFFEAYREGPGGASTDIINFKELVENCQHILNLIKNELQDQGRNLLSSQLKYHALEETLKSCGKVFDTSEFLKARGDQNALKRLYATAAYLWAVEERIQKLSGILQGHIGYIQVFLQLLQRADIKQQIKELKSHGRYLEAQGKHLERHTEYHIFHGQKLEEIQQKLENIQFLLDEQDEPRFITSHSRAQSVTETTATSSGTAVISPAIYQQGQKSLTEVQDLLEQVNLEFENPRITVGQREAFQSVQQELENEEKRILNSIERNQIKGVQNAILRRNIRVRKQRLSRQDSAYASSVGSIEYEQSISAISWRHTELSRESNWGSVVSLAIAEAATLRHTPEQNTVSYMTKEVCNSVKIIFNNGQHKPILFSCTIQANYDGDRLSEIFPNYSGKLSDKVEVPDAPKLLFPQNSPRPIPHIEPRGPNSDEHEHLVQIKGYAKMTPAVQSLEYIFTTFQDSNNFQELVFNKELEPNMPINIRRIYSGRAGKGTRTKETDQVALRVWRIPNNNIAMRKDFSVLFGVKEEGKPIKEHLEIFLHDITTLTNRPGKWLYINLEPEVLTSAGEKLNWLEFQLDRSIKEENKDDRATLAKYLDPSWSPTRELNA